MKAQRQLPSAPPTGDYREDHWPEGLRHRSSGFYFDRVYKGGRHKYSLSDKNEAEAISKANEINWKLKVGLDIKEQGRRQATSFDTFAREVFLKEKAVTTRPLSLTRYRNVCDHFTAYLAEHQPGIHNIESVTAEAAAAFKLHRLSVKITPNGKDAPNSERNGVKPRTLWHELTILRGVFKLAMARGLVNVNPFENVRVSKRQFANQSPHRVLAESEIAKLLEAARRYDESLLSRGNPPEVACFHDIFLTFLKSGLRDGELRHLEWRDLDLEGRFIQVRAKNVTESRLCKMLSEEVSIWSGLVEGKRPGDRVFKRAEQVNGICARLRIRAIADLLTLKVQDVDLANATVSLKKTFEWKPKASEGRIPIGAKLAALLKEQQERFGDRSNFVFPAPDGGICRLHLLDQLQDICREIGIALPVPRIHDLRHTFAATLRRMGVPLEAIMGLMRHSDIRETLAYAPYEEREGRLAVAKLDEAF